MKAIFSLILLSAVFLGGYYLGHKPGSPDIFAWAKGAYAQAQQAKQQISKLIDSQNKAASATPAKSASDAVAVNVDGKRGR